MAATTEDVNDGNATQPRLAALRTAAWSHVDSFPAAVV